MDLIPRSPCLVHHISCKPQRSGGFSSFFQSMRCRCYILTQRVFKCQTTNLILHGSAIFLTPKLSSSWNRKNSWWANSRQKTKRRNAWNRLSSQLEQMRPPNPSKLHTNCGQRSSPMLSKIVAYSCMPSQLSKKARWPQPHHSIGFHLSKVLIMSFHRTLLAPVPHSAFQPNCHQQDSAIISNSIWQQGQSSQDIVFTIALTGRLR